MSSPEVISNDPFESARAAAAEIIQTGNADSVEPRTIQQLLAAAIKLYIAKRESGTAFEPVREGDLTGTEVSETASGLLRAVRLEPFELGWWSRLGHL